MRSPRCARGRARGLYCFEERRTVGWVQSVQSQCGRFFLRLQYVREITEQLMKAKLLKGIQSVNQVPTRYWKTTARKNRPNQRDFVSAREISFADCHPF